MKKNKMMRLASLLLVCVLLSTSVISGTFAKYVTTAESSDTARVAKWGIQMDVDGDEMFTATYTAENTTYSTGANSVEAVDGTAAVVAPGTTSSSIYKVTGAPETDYVISFGGTAATTDVYLAKDATYKYVDTDTDGDGVITYTAPNGKTEATVDADYYPIIYTVKVESTNSKGTIVNKGTTITDLGKTYVFDKLVDALTDLAKVTVKYDDNTECDLVVTISWEWQFDKNTPRKLSWDNSTAVLTESNDALDTVLGDLVASTDELNFTGNSCTTIEYKIVMTATQVD